MTKLIKPASSLTRLHHEGAVIAIGPPTEPGSAAKGIDESSGGRGMLLEDRSAGSYGDVLRLDSYFVGDDLSSEREAALRCSIDQDGYRHEQASGLARVGQPL